MIFSTKIGETRRRGEQKNCDFVLKKCVENFFDWFFAPKEGHFSGDGIVQNWQTKKMDIQVKI